METVKKYTESEKQFIRDLYPNTATREIARMLNRSVRSIYYAAGSMGLKKSKEFIRETSRKNTLKPDHGSKKTQFKKGRTPPNKGKKIEEFMSKQGIENSKKTRFKKGHSPHNQKPVGYERISQNGYIEVKIRDPDVFVLKHRFVYSQKYGEIPKGYNVIFKDGNPRNFDINNLICISNAELMLKNSISRYPKELQELMKLNAKLIKSIKKYETDKHTKVERASI